MSEQRKYRLTLNTKQALVVVQALDLHSRLIAGQVEELGRRFRMERASDPEMTLEQLDRVDDAARLLKAVMFPELRGNAAHGIHSDKIPDEARVAYDLLQVLRNRLAWDENPEGGIQVWFDDPTQTSYEEKPPEMERVEDE